ncbi:MAG: hypothetical protein R3Y54_01310 [Eubacteriales bacterium]
MKVIEYNYLFGYLAPCEDPTLAYKVPYTRPAPKGFEEQTKALERYVELEESQYTYQLVEERYAYYEYLCENLERIAKENSMRMYLKYDEEEYWLEMTITFSNLMFIEDDEVDVKDQISKMFEMFDSFLVEPYRKDYVRIKFSLQVADRIQIADYSEELERIKQQVKIP